MQAFCLKMFRSGVEVYQSARQHSMDGLDTPRFISSVRISHFYTSKNCVVQSPTIVDTPGVLMQYIPGFPLVDLYDSLTPLPSRSTWQDLIDDAGRIVNTISQTLEICNADCHPRNTVVHWDPIGGRWKAKVIDFGHCEFRKEDMSER